MKFTFTLSIILMATTMLVSSAPVGNVPTVAESSIQIINATSNPVVSPTTSSSAAAQTPADALSGANATASITIMGQEASDQSVSGSPRRLVGAGVALPIALLSSVILM